MIKSPSQSIPACTSIECKTGSIADPPKPDHPVDYKVPNYGSDHDIVSTQKHIKDAEATYDHKWNPDKDDDGNWIVPTAFSTSQKLM